MDKIINGFIKVLTFVFGAVSLLLFLCLVYVCITSIFSGKYDCDISEAGIKFFQDFWTDYSILLKGFASCATIFIAGYNLAKYIEVARVEALANFRTMLNDGKKKKLHVDLMAPDDRSLALGIMRAKDIKQVKQMAIPEHKLYTTADVLDYIGIMELGAIMLRSGLISFEEFYNQFGYRVEYLIQNDVVRKHIEKNRKYYKDFQYVVNEMIEHDTLSDKYRIES